MKSKGGKGQREKKSRREKSRRGKIREEQESEKEDAVQVREQVGKSQNIAFFRWFVAPEGRKVGSLKRRVRSQLARWEMNKCTSLWRDAHFQVKMHKTPQLRTAFGSCDFEKVHAGTARSTFRSQNVQSAPCTDRFWMFGSRFAWQAQGIVHRQNVRVLWYSKNDGRRGTFEDNLQRCIFRGTSRRNTRDIFIGAVRRSGWGFPESGCILEHQIFRFAEMILRDRCNTLYELASLFRGRRNTCDRWTRKMAKRIGTRLSALHPTFHVWRKSRRIALFLMLSTSKNEEGSLAELLRFWCCQLWKMRKSHGIAAFLMLSTLKDEEVSQNSWVFNLADRQVDR